MHEDLEKLLQMGRVNAKVAEVLDRVSPGHYCKHATWGTGKVVDWSLPSKKLVIDFEKMPNHDMDMQFAIRKMEWLPEGHFLIDRYENVDELRYMANKEPIALIRRTLTGNGNSMKPEELEAVLKGYVVDEPKWKTWWDKARAEMRTDVSFVMPTKKGESIILRDTDLSYGQAALSDYEAPHDLKARIRVLDAMKPEKLKGEPEKALQLVDMIDKDVRNGGSLAVQQVLELAVLRDDIINQLKLTPNKPVYALADVVKDMYKAGEAQFAEVMNAIPSARQHAIYATLPLIFGEDWIGHALAIFDGTGARAIGEVAKFIAEQDKIKMLVKHLQISLRRQTLMPEGLIWVCRNRKDMAKEAFSMQVGVAMLALIEQDHTDGGPSRMLRLKNLILDDKSLVQDMIRKEDDAEVRQFAKLMYGASAFSEQDRGALMARVMEIKPELHEIVLNAMTDAGGTKALEPLFVSWTSLDNRKKELEDLVNVKIPENLHQKKIARAEGDLRENGGYQDAKEVEKVLNRRRKELEHALARARGTDFIVESLDTVVMGTTVTVKSTDDGSLSTYTILGAWDTDPEKHVVSYLSMLAKALLNRKVGDTVEFVPMDGGDHAKTFTVEKIEAAIHA